MPGRRSRTFLGVDGAHARGQLAFLRGARLSGDNNLIQTDGAFLERDHDAPLARSGGDRCADAPDAPDVERDHRVGDAGEHNAKRPASSVAAPNRVPLTLTCVAGNGFFDGSMTVPVTLGA